MALAKDHCSAEMIQYARRYRCTALQLPRYFRRGSPISSGAMRAEELRLAQAFCYVESSRISTFPPLLIDQQSIGQDVFPIDCGQVAEEAFPLPPSFPHERTGRCSPWAQITGVCGQPVKCLACFQQRESPDHLSVKFVLSTRTCPRAHRFLPR